MTTIVFDMNETLLALDPLDLIFEDILGSVSIKGQWFSQVLHVSMVTTLTGRSPSLSFADVAGIALDTIAKQEGIELSPVDKSAVGEVMRSLPPVASILRQQVKPFRVLATAFVVFCIKWMVMLMCNSEFWVLLPQ